MQFGNSNSSFLYLQRTFKIAPMIEIQQASLALNDSLVYIEKDVFAQKRYLMHLSSDGEPLWKKQLPYQDYSLSFSMITSKIVIILCLKYNLINVYDVDSHEVISVNHNFWPKLSLKGNYLSKNAIPEIIAFSQSNIFCIIEHSEQKKRLSYYCLQNINEDSRPIAMTKIEANYRYGVSKLDEHSKIGFLCCSKKRTNHFIQIELINHRWVMKKEVQVLNREHSPNGYPRKFCLMRQNKLLMLVQQLKLPLSQKLQFLSLNVSQQTDFDRNVVDISSNNPVTSFDPQLMEVILLQHCIVLIKMKEGSNKTVSLMNYQMNQIQEVKTNAIMSQFAKCDWDNRVLMDINEIFGYTSIIAKKWISFKDIYLHFLLSLNEDWDDDLLGDAIDLLI